MECFQTASKFVLTVLLPSEAKKFPVSEPGDRRASSGNFAERGVAGRKRNFAPGAFGPFGPSKGQKKHGNGKWVLQLAQQSVKDKGWRRETGIGRKKVKVKRKKWARG